MRYPLIAFLFALALVLFVSGCATRAQREYIAISENIHSVSTQLSACVTAIYNSPEAAVLRPHRPLDFTEATLQQMADTSKVTDPEIKAILATYQKSHVCRKTAIDQVMQTTPSVALIMAREYADSDQLILSLIQRKLSWGANMSRKLAI